MNISLLLLIKVITCIHIVQGESSYEDARCKCICLVINETQIYKKLYISSVPPNNDCDSVVLPPTGGREINQTAEVCPRCQCKYESRNTTIIKVVVIIVVWIISLLLVYMMFLICLDPLLNNRLRGSNYMEHTNEEDESPNHTSSRFPGQMSISPSASGPGTGEGGSSGNVLNRVSHHQDKWKRQVREQRKNIYDKHTMLN